MKPVSVIAALLLTACDPSYVSRNESTELEPDSSADHAELLQRIADLEADRQALQSTLDDVREVLRYLSVTKDGDLQVTGANLVIVNGERTTEWVNGKGNLILGYNFGVSRRSKRTGSHNLIIGDGHEYLGHSGIAAGLACVIEGAGAVAIGDGNKAGSTATAIGGKWKRASEPYSVLCE